MWPHGGERIVTCEECRELSTHTFRSTDDLIHAIRLATEEVDRGVLSRVTSGSLATAEQAALDSSLASGALPNSVRYRFRCQICGDHFTLHADATSAQGGWTREP
jgi:predicted RNA-binding Zn-ribbon protein involved in translation (DUF1610 family)